MRSLSQFLRTYIPGYYRVARLPKQLLAINPFDGDCKPSRVRILHPGSGRPTLPFPHRWNYHQPVQILESFFWNADNECGSGRHNRYLDVPWFAPVFVTRDPALIRTIATDTGDREGQFDRDTLPSTGIARATGTDTLLYANGPSWRRQRKLAASPFGKTTLFQPEKFNEFSETFRHTIRERMQTLKSHLDSSGQDSALLELEAEIKAVMLEMLTNNFFGAAIPYDELRNRYVPALERIIDTIVSDTVMNRAGIPWWKLPRLNHRIARAQDDFATFEQLTDLVLAPRAAKKALWQQFKSDVPDDVLRSNLKVFLAGALEATTSYATWAISHLARNVVAQQKVYQEVKEIRDYTPENLYQATYLRHALNETLRLTPSLYFLPRQATCDKWITTADGRTLFLPDKTHILLDVWHANRHEDFWGVETTGFPADEFHPERWELLASKGGSSKDVLHFGFGHGPRVCPGKHLGELEVSLVVGAFVRTFKFDAESKENPGRAGVSTKPADGTRTRIAIR